MEITFEGTGTKEELIRQVQEAFTKEIDKWEPAFQFYFMKLMSYGKKAGFTSFDIHDGAKEMSIVGYFRGVSGYSLRVALEKTNFRVNAYYAHKMKGTEAALPIYVSGQTLEKTIPVLDEILELLKNAGTEEEAQNGES